MLFVLTFRSLECYYIIIINLLQILFVCIRSTIRRADVMINFFGQIIVIIIGTAVENVGCSHALFCRYGSDTPAA